MILIVVPKSIGPGVISSQVLTLANFFAKRTKTVVVVDSINFSKIDFSHSNYEIVKSSETFKIRCFLRRADWVYTRDIYSFLNVHLKKKIYQFQYKIFYDFRGLLHEESYFKKKSRTKKLLLYQLEKFASRQADSLGAVSEKLKKFLELSFGTKKPLYITPCCISSATKKPFSKKEQLRFVYLGGLSKWQRFEDILKTYKNIAHKFPSSLTIITKEKNAALEILKDYELKNVSVKSLSQQEVLRDLPNYDYGFLLRHNTLMNNVASPIKLLEYTSNGVIPIISEGVGDYSEKIKNENIGIVLKEGEEPSIEELIVLYNENTLQNLFRFSEKFYWKTFLENHPLVKGF